MKPTRATKLDKMLQHEVAVLLPQFFDEKRFGLLTVTRVTTAKSFDSARVFVSCLKNGHSFLEESGRKIWELQQVLNKRLVMKKVPKIIFDLQTGNNLLSKLEEVESQAR